MCTCLYFVDPAMLSFCRWLSLILPLRVVLGKLGIALRFWLMFTFACGQAHRLITRITSLLLELPVLNNLKVGGSRFLCFSVIHMYISFSANINVFSQLPIHCWHAKDTKLYWLCTAIRSYGAIEL